MWDARRGVLMQTLDLHTDVIYSLSLNRDGSRIVTTSRDKRLRIIDPLSGKILQVSLQGEILWLSTMYVMIKLESILNCA